MHKCQCGQEFEGEYCPNCGTKWQEQKTCPNCGAKLDGSVKFCNECGYSFVKTEQPAQKEKSKFNLLAWLKNHLKIVIPVALAIALIIISCSIPACVKGQTNGTYYKLKSNGEIDQKTYFILKSGKWSDEDGESGTYKKNGEKITFYITFFGETEEVTTGTLKDEVLTVNDDKYVSEKHKHKYGEWETKEPTCISQGYETRSCACGLKETKTIEKIPHKFSDWMTTKEATCLNEGIKSRSCSMCNFTETETIKKGSHNFGDWEMIKEATCTEEGSKHHFCKVCGEESITIINKNSHSMKATTKKATCTEEGSVTYVCSSCGLVEDTQIIEKLPHKLSDWRRDDSSHWKACTVCENKFETGTHDNATNCTVCGYPAVYVLNSKKDGYILKSINKSVTEFSIPSTYNNLPVTNIENSAFRNCTLLTDITILDSVTSIGDYAFDGCTSLTSITIPDSVTSIGDYAFEDCTLLTNIIIPKSVTSIGYNAFSGCSSLTSVTIPDSVTSIGGWAFSGCSSLKYNELDNALYLGNNTNPYLILIETKDKNISSCNINKNTKVIASYAFVDCTSLTSIIIPDSVTSIGDSAFRNCTLLTNIIIPKSVTSIGDSAFTNCYSLTSVTIPDSVTSIGGAVFWNCTSLASITIPDSVISIDYNVFYNCTLLTSINFEGSKAQWEAIEKDNYWDNNSGDYTVYCTDGEIAKANS